MRQEVVTLLGFFFTIWWEPEGGSFYKLLKTTFCEYWTSIKIRISMICVSKDYEIKTKMVQEQWLQLKMSFLFFYWIELTFVGRGEWANFWLVRGTHPIPTGRKTLYIYIYITYITHIIHIIHIHIYIYKGTLPTDFYIQWRSSV